MSEHGGNLRQRAPLRFVWRMDAEHHFTVGSDEFAALTGPTTAAALGRPWPELSAALGLDPEGQIALALASRETWSGLSIAWPVDDGRERLTVELSGLPVFDRERAFRGYRGFGICRDAGRRAAATEAHPAANAVAANAVAAAPGSENVVPLRPSGPTGAPALSPHERQELAARLPQHGASERGAAESRAVLARAQAEIRELKAELSAATGERPDRPEVRPPAQPAKSDLRSDHLAELAQGIRTPLATIIGASEILRQEHGPIDERYRQYVRDIHGAGERLMAQLDDLIDLAKIEAGKLALDFAGVASPACSRRPIATASSSAPRSRPGCRRWSPTRALRQMALNLVAHSTRLAGAGGQVIVSTALTDLGGVVLRVRDSGNRMRENEMALGLKPFRQVAAAVRRDSTGGSLALPLTKAPAQANHASFTIKSAPYAGTLIEVTFPPDRLAGLM
jgi:signal transduction histidine kinase